MVRDDGRFARFATFVLMGVAFATCEVASYSDGQPRPIGVGTGLALLILAIVFNWLGPKPSRVRTRLPWFAVLLLASALALPMALEPLFRGWSNDGLPLELQLVHGLRAAGLLLAGFSAWPQSRRLAGVVALFLALFASAMGDQPAMPYFLAALAVTGGCWLIGDHQARIASSREIAAKGDEVERVRLRLPYREALVFCVLAALAAGVAFAGPKQVRLTLWELVPTSGGTGDTDPFARYGVGDGPEETAGENAQAAGMVETDKMIEDNKNSLIDAVSDMYGPPHKPSKDQERMVAAGLAQVIEKHGRLPDNRRPSRDFDTSRQAPKRDSWLDSQGARGLFEVEGRTPLHIRLVAYDIYNDVEKRWLESRKPGSLMIEAEGGDWMKLGQFRPVDGWYANEDRHRLKVADLKTNLVPTPAMVTRLRIKKVDKAEYYERDYDGVFTIAGRKSTPPGVVVTTDCRTLDPSVLPELAFAESSPTSGSSPVYSEVPAAYCQTLDRFAQNWAGDLPRGWHQIEAILNRLRTEYLLDSRAVAPKDHPAPVLDFLETKRGPDYLFASAAALLLRTLGYPTRICLGYYASPDAYDSETDHTPVKKTDLHVWPEVLLRDGQWLVIEPTPGYALMPPLKPWHERLGDRLIAALGWMRRHAIPLAVIALSVILSIRFRKRIADWLATTRLKLAPGSNWRIVALRTARLLERRSHYAGRPRPADQTLSDWAKERPELAEFVRLAEWAAYSPPHADAPGDVDGVCRRTLNTLTLNAWMRPVAPAGEDAR